MTPTARRRWWKWALRAMLSAVVIGFLAISVRAGYCFSGSGRSHRLLNALQGHEDGLVERGLTSLGLLPPLPDGPYRDNAMYRELKSIRPLTADDYVSLLGNDYVHYQAISALEELGDARVIRPLLVDLRNGKAFDNQIPGLWHRLGDKPFLHLLHDPNSRVREDVVNFLTKQCARRAGDPLEAVLAGLMNDPDPDVRISCAEFLGPRGNEAAVSCLIAEFEQLAVEGREEHAWLKLARRGQITPEELTSRRQRLGRLKRALSALQDARAVKALEAYRDRASEREKLQKSRVLAHTFGPWVQHHDAYMYLVPDMPNAGYYHTTISPEREPVISPPYIVPAITHATQEDLRARFGAPDHVDPNCVWDIRFGQHEKPRAQGIMWAYEPQLEILFVDGAAAWVKTAKPDYRVLWGAYP